MNMPCEAYLEALSRQKAGEDVDGTGMEAHRAGCDSCRRSETFFAAALFSIGPDFREQPSSSLVDQIFAQLDSMPERPDWERGSRPAPRSAPRTNPAPTAGWLESLLSGLGIKPIVGFALAGGLAAAVLVISDDPKKSGESTPGSGQIAYLQRPTRGSITHLDGKVRLLVEEGHARLQHGNHAIVDVDAPARVLLYQGPTVRVDEGRVSFEVNPRAGSDPYRTLAPHLEVEVIGTKYTVHVTAVRSRLEVFEGLVRATTDGVARDLVAGDMLSTEPNVVGPAALPNPDPVLPVIAASQATSEEPVATASHGGGHRSVGGGTGDTRDGHDGSGRPEAPRSGDTAPRSGDTGSAGPHGVEGEPVLVNPDGDLDRMFE